MKWNKALCAYLAIQNPGAQIPEECKGLLSTTTTTTTTSTAPMSSEKTLATDFPILTQMNPKIITTPILTKPTTPTPKTQINPTQSQKTQTPKTQTPKTQTQPDLPSDSDWWAEICQAIKDSPLWAKIMGGLSIAIAVMFLVSRCLKGLAKIIENNNPGRCLGCVDCLKGTAKCANVCGLAFKALRDSLAAVINGNGQLPLEQHETRDTDRLLPGDVPGGPLNSQQDGQVWLATSQM